MTPKRPPAPEPERIEILTSDEVAALLKISKGTLYNNVSAGLFPPGRMIKGLGKRWRRSTVDRWLAEQFDDRTA